METRHEFIVSPDADRMRLDRYLAESMPDLSRARIQALIEAGRVEVDGRPPKASRSLKPGERVVLVVPPPVPVELVPDSEVEFTILYEDADLVVIDKPAGLVVHPAPGSREGTLVHGLLALCPDISGVGGEIRPGIVHRLDKDTSGVMVAAKNEVAHRNLSESFRKGEVHKQYRALCLGRPPTERGEIDAPIGRHPVRRKEMSTRSRSPKPARTKWLMVKTFPLGVSYLKVRIFTGRTHQIRVHLAGIGCPVLGDAVYGKGLGPLTRHPDVSAAVNRQMLHAWRLGLDHPITGQRMEFEAPVPDDMSRVVEVLNRE